MWAMALQADSERVLSLDSGASLCWFTASDEFPMVPFLAAR